jgi:competence protein ComGC
MKKSSFAYRVFDLYYDGFMHMKLGRTLWAIILIKLFIIFVVLKLFFFPNFLKQHAEGDEAGYVATELIERSSIQ